MCVCIYRCVFCEDDNEEDRIMIMRTGDDEEEDEGMPSAGI